MNRRKLTHLEILQRQKENQKQSKLPFCVVLNSIRSLYNVGSIFRTSDGVGVEKIWLCGITGCPPNTKIAKTALGAQDQVPWEYREDSIDLIKELKQNGYQIVLLEQTEGGHLYQEFKPQAPVCLVIGNEVDGITSEILNYCDAAIEIKMNGAKNSLNVAVAFGVVAYSFRNYLKEMLCESFYDVLGYP